MFDKIKEFGTKVIQKSKNVVCALAIGVASLTGLPSGASAEDAVDPTTQITNALSTISGIWDTVSAIIIGVAVVMVGVRFFKKAK